MVRKTKEDAQATRNRILDAAEECFSEQGVSQTTLDVIAQRAGVTRGAIYWYFENKAALFSAMLDRLVCPLLLRQQVEAERLRDDPLACLRAMAGDFLDRVTRDQNFYRVIEILWHKCEYVGEMADIRKEYLDEGEKHIDILHEAFARMQENDQLSPRLTPHQATIALVSLVDGLIFNWTKNNRQLFPLESYSKPILDAFLDSLRGGGSHNP
jgi:TetR/AcrR family acrAB operon transcriptional repressor